MWWVFCFLQPQEYQCFCKEMANSLAYTPIVFYICKIVAEKTINVTSGIEVENIRYADSVTKSVVGTLGAMLVAQGRIDADKRVAEYVPELADSAFGSATVRQVLDMTTGLKYSEDYADRMPVWAHARAGPVAQTQGL